ncbi:splicing factor, arginine/serine-rich 19-like [Lathamus discolor]|uniref:splicing factor, arginine/serine-rich 19-like n=1 Tax=Lathamus discolor TaxID=678569 RepID=UPI0032B87FC7
MDQGRSDPEADSRSDAKEEAPRAMAPVPWSLQGGVDCATSGVLALTALLFKMEEANLASRAKAQELIQATNQILSQTKAPPPLGPSQAPPTTAPLRPPPWLPHTWGEPPPIAGAPPVIGGGSGGGAWGAPHLWGRGWRGREEGQWRWERGQ